MEPNDKSMEVMDGPAMPTAVEELSGPRTERSASAEGGASAGSSLSAERGGTSSERKVSKVSARAKAGLYRAQTTEVSAGVPAKGARGAAGSSRTGGGVAGQNGVSAHRVPAAAPRPNRVRETRIDKMMSKAELARRAGLSVLTIDRVEKGLSCRMDTKRKILEALGLELSDRVHVFGEEL